MERQISCAFWLSAARGHEERENFGLHVMLFGSEYHPLHGLQVVRISRGGPGTGCSVLSVGSDPLCRANMGD